MGGAGVKRKPIVIWGARGHALVLLDFLTEAGYRVIAFFDNDASAVSPVEGVPIHHGERGFVRWLESSRGSRSAACAVAIGGDQGRARLKIQVTMAKAGLTPATLVHPSAVVAKSVALGAGSQVLAGSVIGPRSRIGVASIVNTAASVDHECTIGDGVHIAPGAVLAGCVRVEARAFVGAGAVVLPRIVIGADAVVGAGAVVTKMVSAGAVVVGNPARSRRVRRKAEGK